MNCKIIIEKGYGKLAEKLPKEDKEFLAGFNQAIDCLKNFKFNIDDYIEEDVEILHKIQKEISECIIDNAVEELETEYDEWLISFVDNNHYSIDENGNIYDDNEKGENDE